MKLTKNWHVNATAALLLLTGCVSTQQFKQFNAGTSIEAFKELLSRRDDIEELAGELNIEVFQSEKSLRIRSQVQYSKTSGWLMEFTGPLGMNLGSITFDEDSFSVQLHGARNWMYGSVEEELEIPELQIVLPRFETLGSMIMPTTDLAPGGRWSVVAPDDQSIENIIARRILTNGALQEFRIRCEQTPLRVISETFRHDGAVQFHRILQYADRFSTLPNLVIAEVSGIKLLLSYKFLRINLRRSDD